jgi:hypothetical protein
MRGSLHVVFITLNRVAASNQSLLTNRIPVTNKSVDVEIKQRNK